jgi:hypothetical protein
MINYYFFQFKKNNNRTGPDRVRPVGVRPPGQRWDVFGFFSNLNRLGPARMDREPSGFEPNRPGLDRFQITSH